MRITCLLILLTISLEIRAQETSEQTDFYALSLEELMSIPVSVASKTELTIRESPAILSVITGEEILNLGARDMMDVLNLLPGFSFGVDVQNVIGLASRGNWAHEGKMLVLLDGQEMNEVLFSSTPFGQHFNVNQIERVEIIRGPGSSIYGGYAELGVINIITKSGKILRGVNAMANVGLLSDGVARQTASLAFGNSNEKIQYSFAGNFGQGIRSNKTYTDVYGATLNLKDNSGLQQYNLNLGLQVSDLSFRVMYDAYSNETADQFDEILLPVDKISFNAFYSEIKYDLKIGDKLTLTPKVNFKSGEPWKSKDVSPFSYSVKVNRTSPSLNANWNPTTLINVIGGLDSYIDNAEHTGSNSDYFGPESTTVSYNNIGAFAQLHIKNSTLPIFVGARYDKHSEFGSAFSPRFGVTKVYDKWHFKLLYSRAFRAPAIENIRTNSAIKPEKTGVAELEFGFELTSNMALTANVYDIRITDPIVYFVDAQFPSGAYQNFSQGGSRGFELDYKYRAKGISIGINYSFYTTKNINEVDLYRVPGKENLALAWPSSKVNLYGTFRVATNFTINPSVSYTSKRYGFSSTDVNDDLVLTTYDPATYVNLFLNYDNLFTNGLSIGAGVYDLLDEVQNFIQPYASGHAPLPGVGREILVRVGYTIPFK